jgi:ribosomal protein S18 acetylase RimI-like enzyme
MASAENVPRPVGTIWMLDLDRPAPVITSFVAAVFHRLEPGSISLLAPALGSDTLKEIRQRFETGRRCYAAWVGGQLAAYGWVSFDQEFIGELSLRLRLPPGEAYIWDCATLPAFRQQHLYSALLAYMLGELRGEKLRRVWIGTNEENLASQRGIARAGFQHVADLFIMRVLAVRQAWVLGLPDVPDSLVADARRVFLDNRDMVWLSAVTSTISDSPR